MLNNVISTMVGNPYCRCAWNMGNWCQRQISHVEAMLVHKWSRACNQSNCPKKNRIIKGHIKKGTNLSMADLKNHIMTLSKHLFNIHTCI